MVAEKELLVCCSDFNLVVLLMVRAQDRVQEVRGITAALLSVLGYVTRTTVSTCSKHVIVDQS